MRYIKNLNEKEIEELNRLSVNINNNYQEQNRAKSILLSHKMYSISVLCDIFNVKNQSIYKWFNSWEKEGIKGLYNKKGRGRNKIYTNEDEIIIINLIEINSRDINKVLIGIHDKLNKKSSRDTIKRILLRHNFRWKRIKRVPKGKPNEEEYKKKQKN